MKPENRKMRDFLALNGIQASVKHIDDGSITGCWRIQNVNQVWTRDLLNKFNELEFKDTSGQPLDRFSTHDFGEVFQIFVTAGYPLAHTTKEARG